MEDGDYKRYLDCYCGKSFPTGTITEDCPVYKQGGVEWPWYVDEADSYDTRTVVYRGTYMYVIFAAILLPFCRTMFHTCIDRYM